MQEIWYKENLLSKQFKVTYYSSGEHQQTSLTFDPCPQSSFIKGK